MKSLIFALVSCVSLSSFAARTLECSLSEYGQVNLSLVYSEKVPQRFDFYVGQEKWSNPYAFLKVCEQLKQELTSEPVEQWEDYGCYEDGVAMNRLVFVANISEKGAILHGSLRKKTISFIPSPPVMDQFIVLKPASDCVIDYL